MTPNQKIWTLSRNDLARAVASLGYPEEFADLLAKQLGSPKAIQRMTAYLYNVKPGNVELVVDEMLAICSEIAAWKEKKASEAANAKYNYILNYGLTDE